MDVLDKEFLAYSRNRNFTSAICAAVLLAKQTLNRYYSLTDSSEVYQIAMILHPRHKLTYFKNTGWESEWIKTVEALVCNEFEFSYAASEHYSSDAEPADASDEQVGRAKPPSGNIFDNMDAFAAPKAGDLRTEIVRYLAADIEKTDNPLKWWHDRRAVYPQLAQMGLDYLSIPPTSVDVERLFSRGRLLLSHVRSRLSVDSTRALLCLGAWSLLGLVKNEDVKRMSSMPDVVDGEDVLDDCWAGQGTGTIDLTVD